MCWTQYRVFGQDAGQIGRTEAFQCLTYKSQFAGTPGSISSACSASKPGEPRVAQIAFLRPPGVSVVMAGAAEFSILDICHGYIVGTRAHLETDFSVTYIAFEADAMKPVRKDNRAHPGFFCPLVEYYVPVFGTGWGWGKQSEQGQQNHPFGQITENLMLISDIA